MFTKHLTLLPLLIMMLSLVFCGCSAIFPNDKSVEFELFSYSGKNIRGLEKITIKSNLKVKIYGSQGICTGNVAPWLYKELMDSVTEMHFKDKMRLLISDEKEPGFIIKARVIDQDHHHETFEWKADNSSIYNPVLLNFKKIQSQVINTGSCSIKK